MNIMSSMYFGIPYHRASAGEFVWCFREMFNAADFGYIKGSTGSIAAAFRRGWRSSGAPCASARSVEKILVENGRAVGVRTPAGDIAADLVISNAGIPVTVKLAGEEAVGANYARFAAGLRLLRDGGDRPLLPRQQGAQGPLHGLHPRCLFGEHVQASRQGGSLPEDTWLFMPVIDLWDPEIVPAGKQLIIAATASPLGGSPEVDQAIAEMVKKLLYGIYPDMEKHVTSTEVVTK